MLFNEPCPTCGFVEPPVVDDLFQVCQHCHEGFGLDSGHVFNGELDLCHSTKAQSESSESL